MSKSKVKPGSPDDQNVDKSHYVPQREKIGFDLKVNPKFKPTENQQKVLDLLSGKECSTLIIKGPPGSAKSYVAILAALLALEAKKISDIHFLRQPVESSSFNIGFLKGDQKSKLDPYMEVLNSKLREFLSELAIKQLEKEERLKTNTPGFMRGASINASYIINDECQNYLIKDFLLMMTRTGPFTKQIFCGDIRQVDVKGSGFEQVYHLFDNEESRARGIYCFSFGRADIVRSPTIAYILDKFEELGK